RLGEVGQGEEAHPVRGWGGAVGDGAHGEQVGSRLRVGTRGLGRDAPRRLDRYLRPGTPHPRGYTLGRLIIDQAVAHAGGEGPLELRIVLDLDDHRQSGWGRPKRPSKISRPEQRPVVVFPEYGTGERV